MKYVGKMQKPVQQHLRTETLLVYGRSNKIFFFCFLLRIAEACVRFKNVPHCCRFVGFQKRICSRLLTTTEKCFRSYKARRLCEDLEGGDCCAQCTRAVKSCFLFYEAFYNGTQLPTYYYQPTTTNNVHPQTVDASVTLTSGGQITVVGWESSNCRDFSTTAYFST